MKYWNMVWMLGAVLVLPCALVRAQEKAAQSKAAQDKPKVVRPSKEAQAAKQGADAIRARAKGKKGADRQAILVEAAAAYVKVAQDFAKEPVGAAPASFEAAEIWRAQGDLDRAKGLYEKTIELDAARFGDRCRLQLAHIARRSKNPGGAVELYRKVAASKPGSGRAHEARLWIARVHASSGKPDDALTAFRDAVDKAATPRQVIDGCNRWAALLVKLKRLDDAETVITRAATASKTTSTAKGKVAERQAKSLAKAYAAMSARRALQRARDKANKAHQDAVDVDKSSKTSKR